jgi:hypothetical protein
MKTILKSATLCPTSALKKGIFTLPPVKKKEFDKIKKNLPNFFKIFGPSSNIAFEKFFHLQIVI